jgi:hypothetical protein
VSGRSLIVAALACYVLIVGCALLPAQSPTANATSAPLAAPPATSAGAPLTGLPYRGVGMQIQRVDWMDRYKQGIDEVAALGADTVSLVVDSRQENGSSNRIYIDVRLTPTPEQLGGLIQHARARGLRVILMPIVLLDAPRNNEWRGTIAPQEWEAWWASYRSVLGHFAWIAQSYGANVLSVGSELVSTEDERFVDEWRRVIREVRQVFHGQLTYSANWDHYRAVKFWDQLDLIGMNSYYKLGSDKNVQVPEIVSRWTEIQKDLLAFQQQTGKPLLFLEVGWCSLTNAAHEPWDYTKTTEAIDLDLQKRLYEGYFQSWYGKPQLGGFMIWEWTPGDGGPKDRGYTPEGKPAEAVVKEWLAKPRWDVK